MISCMSALSFIGMVKLTIRIRGTPLDEGICHRQNRLMVYVCLSSRILGLGKVISILISLESNYLPEERTHFGICSKGSTTFRRGS
jgi:hypothetical protein